MNIYPKKSLGQNFLIDQNIIKKIISLTMIKDEEILEVGPGTGNLTEKIIEKHPSKIFLIEKDKNLCDLLINKFDKKINIVNKDVLSVNEHKISNNPMIVFGNLPYNISTEILLKWILNLGSEIWFKELILMFQKEVADRIIAKVNSSNYGRLSIISQWRLDITKIIDIKPSSFKPKPKIESSVLHFFPKKNCINLKSKNLELITRVFFNHRRKMIKKPIVQLFKDPSLIYEKFDLDYKLRPQNLSPETYFDLAKEFEKLRS